MRRREFLVAVSALSGAWTWRPVSLDAQDVEFVRAWERAQRARPAELASRARLAAADEPGTPLVIHGRLFKGDGRTPAPGIMVFGYQTDRNGLYDRPEAGAHSWRLRGWARTDAEGRFEFTTIRPASYPGSNIPAHIHWSIEGPGVQRRWTHELQFQDDKFLRAEDRKASEKEGTFAWIRPVEVRAGVQHVDFFLKITETGKF